MCRIITPIHKMSFKTKKVITEQTTFSLNMPGLKKFKSEKDCFSP